MAFSYDKDIWIAANDYHTHSFILYYYPIFIDIYFPSNKFYSVIIFSLLVSAVILLLF